MPTPVSPAGATNFVLQETLGAYSDEAYTNAKKLSSTAIVSGNPQIDTATETFIGQMRWFKPLNPTINVASLTDSTAGTKTTYGSDYQQYIKTVRTHGYEKINLQQVVTQVDGLAKLGRDFGETHAQDEHNAILSVLKGVAVSEVLNGAATGSGSAGLGGQTFYNDPTDRRYGFYVDLGAAPVIAATAAVQGAARAEAFIRAFGMAYKDYEPDYAYLVTSPAIMASLRSANLVDEDRVVDGNVEFSTIFQGKFRLINTRANTALTSAEITKLNIGAGVDITANSFTSFIVLPGALAMESLAIPDDTEIFRNPGAYQGGGTTEVWHRWGYVVAPAGYSWAGPEEAFPSDADYMSVMDGTTKRTVAGMVDANIANVRGIWQRKAMSALSLGILPIFHQ